jgi:aminopeptidase N
MLQATRPSRWATAAGQARARAKALLKHPDFSLRNPNRARSLVHNAVHRQPGGLPPQDAAGYVFWADKLLELDALNPQLAAAWPAPWTAGPRWPSPTAAPRAKPSPAWPPSPT